MAKIGLVNVDHKPGNAARVFSKLAEARVLVNDIIQTEVGPKKANLTFTVGSSDLKAAKKAIDDVRDTVGCEDIFVHDNIAEVSIIGVGMREYRFDNHKRNPHKLCGREKRCRAGVNCGMQGLRPRQARRQTKEISEKIDPAVSL
jgi:hypothetical protein